MATLSFSQLTEAQKMEAADILQKIEAVDSAVADVQSARATFEQESRDKDNFLQTERNILITALRNLRKASITFDTKV